MEGMEDIELCKVLDEDVKQKIMYLMIRNRIPYAERWDEIPFLKRGKYHGAKEICVILTHPEQRSKAIEMIHSLEKEDVNQIILE